MTHKTWSGMARASERLIAELQGWTPDSDREYRAMRKRVDAIHRELGCAWSNPADADEARAIGNRLTDAWNARFEVA